MKRENIIGMIFEISKEENAFDKMENALKDISKEDLSKNIIECGILPEVFSHDSSEEKLWAKYSDVMLSHALNHIGIKSRVLRARGNSADVFGQTDTYTIVGDAKTFRLSRTAKNQKDFKIKSLDDWRKHDTYAVLVSPLYQYPSKGSQIYFQAVDKNITLLSYVHLKYLLDFHTNENLSELWETGKRLKKKLKSTEFSSAQVYWGEIDRVICGILKRSLESLKMYKEQEIIKTKELGEEGIRYWEGKINSYQRLTKWEAVKKLVEVEKIDTKIKTIQKSINKEYIV